MLFVAGAETTVNLALALVYVLASYPDIQIRGQTEIDSVVGLDRLPAVTDIQDLPYVHAIVKEVGRWFTVVPLGECQISPFLFLVNSFNSRSLTPRRTPLEL